VRLELLHWARELFGRSVLHVFDRNYASKEWLGLLLATRTAFCCAGLQLTTCSMYKPKEKSQPLFCGPSGHFFQTGEGGGIWLEDAR